MHSKQSDNSTNFLAAAKKIRDMFASWNRFIWTINCQPKTSSGTSSNPPAAPHSGDAWEHLICSAKAALAAVLDGVTLTDEILLTSMAVVEDILYSRPLPI